MSNDNIWQRVVAALEIDKPIITTNNDDLVQRVAAYEPLLALKSPRDQRVLEALRRVDRKKFIPSLREVLMAEKDVFFLRTRLEAVYGLSADGDCPAEFPDRAIYDDKPIPIGYDQTCSQPAVVAFMTDLLGIEEGMKILEVGTGCGYGAAILAELVGPSGQVTSVERIAGLAELAQRNLEAHFGPDYQKRVSVVLTDGSSGWADRAPYEVIILTAGIQPRLFDPITSSQRFDSTALAQQVPNGVLLYPEHLGPITRETYRDGHLEKRETFGNFGFVPLQKGVVEKNETP